MRLSVVVSFLDGRRSRAPSHSYESHLTSQLCRNSALHARDLFATHFSSAYSHRLGLLYDFGIALSSYTLALTIVGPSNCLSWSHNTNVDSEFRLAHNTIAHVKVVYATKSPPSANQSGASTKNSPSIFAMGKSAYAYLRHPGLAGGGDMPNNDGRFARTSKSIDDLSASSSTLRVKCLPGVIEHVDEPENRFYTP